MKKWIIISAIGLLSLGIFLNYYSFPVSVQIVHRAVQFNYGEPESAIPTEVFIEGVLKRPLWRDHQFSGHMIWEHDERTKIHHSEVILNKSGMSFISYFGVTYDNQPSVFNLGRADIQGVFDELFVEVSISEVKRLEHSSSVFLAAPAGSYEEGMSMVREYYESRFLPN